MTVTVVSAEVMAAVVRAMLKDRMDFMIASCCVLIVLNVVYMVCRFVVSHNAHGFRMLAGYRT